MKAGSLPSNVICFTDDAPMTLRVPESSWITVRDDRLPGNLPGDTFTITPTQDGLDRWWTELYVGVKRCNVVIEKVPLITMDGGLQNRYIAEARFVRGLIYFDFVRAWGGVPLVTAGNSREFGGLPKRQARHLG